MSKYLKGRKHLLPIVRQLQKHNSWASNKIARIMTGESLSETIGYVDNDSMKNDGINKKARIIINIRCILHMDNSGHFTGNGFGPHGHDDNKPLSPADIDEAFILIRSISDFSDINIRNNKNKRRLVLEKNKKVIVLDIAEKENRLEIVTIYNR